MSYQRESWRDYVKRQRAEQNRRRNQSETLKGGTDHDRRRNITQEQLEHAHDSNAYDLAMYEANQDAPAPGNRAPSPYVPPPGGNQPSQSSHNHRDRRGSQSSEQGSSSKSDEQNDKGSDKSDNETNTQKKASSQQSTSELPPDIVSEREITEADVLKFCRYICEKDEDVFTQVMKILEGFDADDDEQTIQERVEQYLRLLGLNGYFPPAKAYAVPLNSIYIPTTSETTGNPEDPDKSDTATESGRMAAEQQVIVEMPEVDTSKLNHRTRDYLSKAFPGEWNPDWTTKVQLREFLVERLRARYPSMNADLLLWDELSIEEVVHLYKIGLVEGSILAEHTMVGDREGFARFIEEHGRTIELLEMVEETPVENLDVLLAAYSSDVESEADAVDFFRNRVEVLYPKLGLALPANLSEINDAVQLANMYFVGLERFKAYEDGQNVFFDATVGDWQGFYGPPQGSLDHDYNVLAGTYQPPDISMLVFVASIFIEPLDWALTTVEVVDAAMRGDWGSALESALWGIVPFVPGSAKHITRIVNQVSNVTPNISRAAEGLNASAEAAGMARFGPKTTPSVTSLSTSADLLPKQSYRLPGSDYVPRVSLEDFKHGSSSDNANQLRREAANARKSAPDEFEALNTTGTDIEIHHIIPGRESWAVDAREILLVKEIHPNSAYNGVALTEHVHRKVVHGPGRRKVYAQTLSKAIVRMKHESPETIVDFLRQAGLRLYGLNSFADSSQELSDAFADFLDWVNDY